MADNSGLAFLSCGLDDSPLTIVCIHGWACRGSDYSYLFDEFKKQDMKYRAIAPDLPGHGSSSSEHYPNPSIETFANAALGLCRDLKLSDVVLAGHSMGVRMVLEMWRQARRSQDMPRVKGLIFIDGSHYKFRKTLFQFDSGNPQSKTFTDNEKAKQMAYVFKRMFSEQTPLEFQESCLAHVRSMDMRYNEAMRMGFVTWDYDQMDDVTEQLGKTDLPLLSFQSTNVDEHNQRIQLEPGEHSQWMQYIQQSVPQAKQIVVDEAMHFPHVDQPTAVASQIISFIDSLKR